MQKFVAALIGVSVMVVVGVWQAGAWGQQADGDQADQPYFGLNLDSYGPRAPVRDGRFVMSADNWCPVGVGFAADLRTEALEPETQAAFRNPISGERPVDELADRSLVSAELVNNFRILSGRTFFRTEEDRGAVVAILSRDDDHITFWRARPYIGYFEVRDGAREWCGRRNKRAVPQGQARQCGPQIAYSGPRIGALTSAFTGALNRATADDQRRLQEDTCESLYGRRDHPLCQANNSAQSAGGTIQSTYYINHFTCEAPE